MFLQVFGKLAELIQKEPYTAGDVKAMILDNAMPLRVFLPILVLDHIMAVQPGPKPDAPHPMASDHGGPLHAGRRRHRAARTPQGSGLPYTSSGEACLYSRRVH